MTAIIKKQFVAPQSCVQIAFYWQHLKEEQNQIDFLRTNLKFQNIYLDMS